MTTIKFEKPPLREVVFDVGFEEPAAMTAVHFGLVWESFRQEFPTTEDHPQLIDPNFDGGLLTSPRVWFIHHDDTRVIQVQKNRFIYNWRRRGGEYPSFDVVYPEFKRHFSTFKRALEELGVPPVRARKLELKYINLIRPGDVWETYSDISRILPDLSWRSSRDRFLSGPDDLNVSFRFNMPDSNGELVASLSSGIERHTKERVLQLELRVSGATSSEGNIEIEEWFSIAHLAIVNTFVDLTSESIQHNVWGRRK
jgi:uncharacterized protein (TIGR04255 family)